MIHFFLILNFNVGTRQESWATGHVPYISQLPTVISTLSPIRTRLPSFSICLEIPVDFHIPILNKVWGFCCDGPSLLSVLSSRSAVLLF